ncbi:hypothetical protein [Burkholderia plantarii]|uniref:hypothetical protein n=1 Tax=Burkholderia plantarii TaxID=41899 RepID=UPI0006D8A608|nr:hypothetical protein [Burkholderia plantarii]ALK28937.1 putative cell wall surface anchor family protein [Burkholderia plantarii]GLZ17621.1 hypothetical protein Bpla01_11510 [Burkholderia plantarii]
MTNLPATTCVATMWGPSPGSTPSSFAFDSPFTDVLTPNAVSTVEQAVQVRLGWQAGGECYLNTWQHGQP